MLPFTRSVVFLQCARVSALLLLPALSLGAQNPPAHDTVTTLSASEVRACTTRAFIPSVQLVQGSAEEPFLASGVTIRDSASGDTLYRGRADAKRPGWWLLLEQTVLAPDAVRDGRDVVLEISAPNQPVSTIPRALGLDPSGCYIVLRGDQLIRL